MARDLRQIRSLASALTRKLAAPASRVGRRGTRPADAAAGRGDDAVPAPPRRGPRAVTPSSAARLEVAYEPCRDGDADPGEVVWTWVPYEDDPSQGKDRPVLVVGRWGVDVAALALTSRAHDDRHHHPLGVWDGRDGRPSWVKLDRLLRLDPDAIRREGQVLDEVRFRATVTAWEAY